MTLLPSQYIRDNKVYTDHPDSGAPVLVGAVPTGNYALNNPNFSVPAGTTSKNNVSTTFDATSFIDPVQPINLPQNTSTSAEGITGASAGVMDSLNKMLTEDTAAKATEEKAQRGVLGRITDAISNKQTDRAALEGDPNTPGTPAFLKETARKASNALDVSQRAQVNELRSLQSAPLSDVQRGARQAEINRKYAFEQADLQLTAHLADSDYTAAEDTLNKKLELELEPLKAKLDTETNIYNQIKDTLTKSQDRQWTNLISTTNNRIETETANRKAVGEALIKASQDGANIPSSVFKQASNAQDLNELSQILARNGVSLAKPATGLPAAAQTRVQGIAGQFDAEQAVKSYQIAAEAIDALKNAGTSPTDDQSRIYAFAKVMDPNSVVRESEYKTVQDYSQTLLQRTGFKLKRVFDNTGFLTPEARKYMEDTLDNRLASSRKAYDNIYSEYGRRIDKVTGGADGKDYLTDYSRAFVDNSGVLKSPDGKQQVDSKDLTPAQLEEAKKAGWK